jgi:hypothetical protein
MKPVPKVRICAVLGRQLPAGLAAVHISPMLVSPMDQAIPKGPNVDGGRGFPAIVLASPPKAWPSPQSSTGYPAS